MKWFAFYEYAWLTAFFCCAKFCTVYRPDEVRAAISPSAIAAISPSAIHDQSGSRMGQLMSRIGTLSLPLVVAMLMTPAVHAQQTRPQVPVSHGYAGGNPEALGQLGADLPPVAAEPGPNPAPPLKTLKLKGLSEPNRFDEAKASNELKGLEGLKSLKELTEFVFSKEGTPAGLWSNLANIPPGGPYNFDNPLLLTDGTVIVQHTDTRDWYKLTPSNTGSYVNGTWTKVASMQSGYGPKFFASAVLPDGRVIVEGGEYNLGGGETWGTQGSIYDPTVGASGAWTAVSPPAGWGLIGDAQSAVLANGTFMVASCCDIPFRAALFNPSNLSWSSTGTNKADRYDEESWTLLPDQSLLTVDAYTTAIGATTCGLDSERYNPLIGNWSTASDVPSQLSDCNNANTDGGSNPSFEIGPQVLMYNGKVIAFGGTTANVAHTALYNTANNTWAAGPDLPSACGSSGTSPCTLADGPATLLPNGNVLSVASAGKFKTPASFFEYDATSNSHRPVPGTSDASTITSFYVNFLTLPTGQILAVETYTSTISGLHAFWNLPGRMGAGDH